MHAIPRWIRNDNKDFRDDGEFLGVVSSQSHITLQLGRKVQISVNKVCM